MKKFIFLASLVILAFSCQKTEIPVVEDEVLYSLSFVSEKPSFDDATKTAWNGSNVSWVAGDQMRAGWYDVTNSSWGTKTPSFKIQVADASTGVFKPESNVPLVADNVYRFYAVFPSAAYPNGKNDWLTAPELELVVPSVQAIVDGTFDPKADVMVGKAVEDFTALAKIAQTKEGVDIDGLPSTTAVSMKWERIVALSEITLKNLPFDLSKEKVTSVKMTAQDGAVLTGKINVDLSTREWTPVNDAVENSVECTGMKTLSSNSMTVWFSTLPFKASALEFVITTTGHTYTKSYNSVNLDFKRNYRNILGVNMSNATVEDLPSTGEEWVLTDVSLIPSDAEVVYVGKVGETYYALSNDKGASAAPTAVPVSVEGDKVISVVEDNIKWNISLTEDGIKIMPSGSTDSWLYCINNNNGLRVGTGTDNVFVIADDYLKNFSQGRYIGIYNKADWRSYTSINSNITGQSFGFYAKTTGTVTPPSDKELIAIEAEGTAEYLVKGSEFSHNGITIIALWDDESETDVTSECTFSGYDMSQVGEQTVTVSYLGETCTYKVNVLERATLAIKDIQVIYGDDIVPEVSTNVTGDYLIEYVSDNEDVVIAVGDELCCGNVTGSASIHATLVSDGYTTAETDFTVTVTRPLSGETHTATFSVNGTASTSTFAEGATIVFPADPSTVNGYAFVGWTTTVINGTTDAEPTFVETSTATMGTADIAYYAVFAKQGAPSGYKLVSSVKEDNTYVFATSNAAGNAYALDGSVLPSTANNSVKGSAKAVVISDASGEKIITAIDLNLEFKFNGGNDFDVVSSTSGEKLLINGSGIGKRATGYKAYWDNEKGLYGTNSNGDKQYYVQLGQDGLMKADNGPGRVYAYEKQSATSGSSSEYCTTVPEEETPTTKVDPTISTTNKTVSVGQSVDVTTMFSSNSNGSITYSIQSNPDNAGTLSGTTFTASAAGTYVIGATQLETTQYYSAYKTATVTVTAPSSTVTYEKVTDLSVLVKGAKFIIACDTKNKYAGPIEGTNQFFSSVSDRSDAAVFTMEGSLINGNKTASFSYNSRMVGTSKEKEISITSGTTTWSFSISNGNVSITSTKSGCGTIKYNASSPRFVNYASGQTDVQLYLVK